MDVLVVATFLIVAALEVLVPLVVGYLIIRRFSLSWKLFGLGALAFVIVQVVHAPLVLLIQQPLLESLQALFPSGNMALALFSLTLGFLAGIFEEPARYAFIRWIFPRLGFLQKRDRGLLFGIGWGGIESIFIAGLLLLTMVSYLSAAPLTHEQIQGINSSMGGTLTEQQIQAMNAQMEALINLTAADILPGLAERMMTIIHQVAWTLMVLAGGRLFTLSLSCRGDRLAHPPRRRCRVPGADERHPPRRDPDLCLHPDRDRVPHLAVAQVWGSGEQGSRLIE
jgi:uncharacterized membrane protein YhfC